MNPWIRSIPIVLALAAGLLAQDPAEDQKLTIQTKVVPSPARAGETVTLEITATVEPGWHVYGGKNHQTPTELSLDAAGLQKLGDPIVPEGERHTSEGAPSFANWHLEGTFVIRQLLRVPPGSAPRTVKLTGNVHFMACDADMCLPEADLGVTAELVVEAGAARDEHLAAAPPPPASGGSAPSSWLLLLLQAIGAGLFTLVMPCTYPMIPITYSFFTKQADARGGRVMPLALTYGVGIVLIFVVIGLVFGSVIGAFASHWLTNLVFAAVFVFFALALFGLVNLQPPRFLLDYAAKASRPGGYLGVFLMGATFVITSFTCTAPFVGTLLATASSEGAARVTIAMAVFGITVALPFVVLALVPGKLKALPRSGEWMNKVKVYLGFIELAAALKFLSNVDVVVNYEAVWLRRDVFLWLWTVILGIAGLYVLGVFDRRKPGTGFAITGVLTLALAGYCTYGALGYPLDRHVMAALAPPGRVPLHQVVKDDYEAARTKALAEHKLLLVNFTGFT